MNKGDTVRVTLRVAPDSEVMVGHVVAIRNDESRFKAHYKVELTDRSHRLFKKYSPNKIADKMPSQLWFPASRLEVL